MYSRYERCVLISDCNHYLFIFVLDTKSNEDIKLKVIKLFTNLEESLDPKGYILNKLFEKEIINFDKKSQVIEKADAASRTDALFDLLLTLSHPRAFIIFRKALQKDYQWLVDLIDDSSEG